MIQGTSSTKTSWIVVQNSWVITGILHAQALSRPWLPGMRVHAAVMEPTKKVLNNAPTMAR